MSRLYNSVEINGKLGSFWNDNMSGKSKDIARSLSRLVTQSRAADQFLAARHQMAQEPGITGTGLSWAFTDADIEVLGPDVQARIVTKYGDTSGRTFVLSRRPLSYDMLGVLPLEVEDADPLTVLQTAASPGILLFPSSSDTGVTLEDIDSRPLYAMPHPLGHLPLSVCIPGRLLLLGVDYTAGDGVLLFREHPLMLFPDQIVVAQSSRQALGNLFNFTYSIDTIQGPGDHIAAYMRVGSNNIRLQRALAQATGLTLVPADCVVELVISRHVGARYITSRGVLDALYKHKALRAGDMLLKDTIIGGGIRVLRGEHYRETSWSGGLKTGWFTAAKNLVIPDASCRVEVTGVHARIRMGNAAALEDAFWASAALGEVASGFYIKDVLSLNDGDVSYLNPLDFFFKYLLADSAVIVELNLSMVGEQFRQRALRFVRENPPIGTNLIVNEI